MFLFSFQWVPQVFEDKDQNCNIILIASTLLGNYTIHKEYRFSFSIEILSLNLTLHSSVNIFLKFLLNWLFSSPRTGAHNVDLTCVLGGRGASNDSEIQIDPQEDPMEQHLEMVRKGYICQNQCSLWWLLSHPSHPLRWVALGKSHVKQKVSTSHYNIQKMVIKLMGRKSRLHGRTLTGMWW